MNNKNILTIIVIVLALIAIGYYYSVSRENTDATKDGVSIIKEEDGAINVKDDQVTIGTSKPVTAVTNTTNYIRIGQKVTLNDVSITPTKVSYDSRCPKDVKCVQAGSLDLSVLLEKGNLAQTLIITSGKPVVFGNRTITLTSILPTRLSTKTILEADYRFVLTVTK